MKEKKNGYIYYDYNKKSEKEIISATAWRSVFRWLYVIVGMLFVFFSASMICFHVISVDGESMRPTLNDKDKIFVYTLNYEPQVGDIVVMGDGSDESVVIKRVIALENQIVNVDYATGTITVDGKPIDEKYNFPMTQRVDNEVAYPYLVEKGSIFVLGDNRDDSRDSRYRSIGSIDKNLIVGKAVFRLYPFSQFDIYGNGEVNK